MTATQERRTIKVGLEILKGIRTDTHDQALREWSGFVSGIQAALTAAEARRVLGAIEPRIYAAK